MAITGFFASGVITGISSLLIGFFVYRNAANRKLARWWLLFAAAVSVWGFGGTAVALTNDRVWALWFWRTSFAFGVIWIPMFFLHFVYEFCGIAKRRFLHAAYLGNFIFMGLSFTPFFIPDVRYVFDTFYYCVPGAYVFPFFLAWWMATFCLSLLFLAATLREADTHKRKQIQYTFIAIAIGAIGGSLNFLPVYGIDLYPWGNFAIPFYPLILSYAIVKHQLMEIEVVIRRAAVFAGLFTFVYAAFSFAVILGKQIFERTLGWNETAALIPIAVLITLALRPLDNLLTNATEKFLFQKKYDYRQLLKTFTNEILTVLDLQKLTEQTVTGLTKIVKLESACILLYDKETKIYRLAASSGLKEKEVVFKENDTLVECLRASHNPIIKDRNADRIHGDGSLKNNFKALNAELCLPISLHDDLVGILAMGMKKSGAEYTQEDIDILHSLARTEAIAISNARLFDELSKTQAEAAQREKMAVIGTLAAGINHEICNPLGIVRGHCELFLLNNRDGFYNDKPQEEVLKTASEIMAKVIRETDRATAITKKLSSFAKPSRRTEMEEVRVEKEVDEVVGLVGHDLRLNNIDIRKDFPTNFPVIFADRKQIQEVLFNIIRNAAQAINKKEGHILVSGFADDGAAVVRISDNGMGIPQDKLNHIFSPFYTTKGPGEGTGLGLFIVKQVVERNRGAISVESETEVGTTFTLRFPTAMAALAAGR
ncbi:MAG: ATP-binding protein [Candidatus Omnitrophota bacterium]